MNTTKSRSAASHSTTLEQAASDLISAAYDEVSPNAPSMAYKPDVMRVLARKAASQSARIAELEAALARSREHGQEQHVARLTDKDAAARRIAELEGALIAFCDADLANLQERSACRRRAYDALALLANKGE